MFVSQRKIGDAKIKAFANRKTLANIKIQPIIKSKHIGGAAKLKRVLSFITLGASPIFEPANN